jgi:hypothetical protein
MLVRVGAVLPSARYQARYKGPDGRPTPHRQRSPPTRTPKRSCGGLTQTSSESGVESPSKVNRHRLPSVSSPSVSYAAAQRPPPKPRTASDYLPLPDKLITKQMSTPDTSTSSTKRRPCSACTATPRSSRSCSLWSTTNCSATNLPRIRGAGTARPVDEAARYRPSAAPHVNWSLVCCLFA